MRAHSWEQDKTFVVVVVEIWGRYRRSQSSIAHKARVALLLYLIFILVSEQAQAKSEQR